MDGFIQPASADNTTKLVEENTENVMLLPLVITKVNSSHGCVSALSEEGRWLRPEPVLLEDIESENPYFAFGQSVFCRLAPSIDPEPRPEDRELVARLPVNSPVNSWTASNLESWLENKCDRDVEACFADDRTVGLIEVVAERVYIQRSTQQRYLVRLAFRDGSDCVHDWVVPDVTFSSLVVKLVLEGESHEGICAILLSALRSTRIFLAAVLTKPINRARGIIRGCQPLVGGVHTFPSYVTLFNNAVNNVS